MIGSLCPVIFYHTHSTKRYFLKSYRGNLRIYLNGQSVSARALFDTGNRLYEPITGKPVCLVEYEYLKRYLKDFMISKGVRVIPYHTIGQNHGILLGITSDKVIFENHGKKYEQSGCIIGIYHGKLSQSGDFHAIVHPDILKK